MEGGEEEEAGCGEAARPMRVWSCMWRARRHTDAGAAREEAKRCAPETTRRIAWLVSREGKRCRFEMIARSDGQ